MTDWLDIVEAAYDVQEPSHQKWLKRLMGVAGTKMGNAQGATAALFHFPRGEALQIFPHHLAPDGYREGAERFAKNEQPLMRVLFGGTPFATMSMLIGRKAFLDSDVFQSSLRPIGIGDMLGLVARDPGPWGVNVGVAVGKTQRISSARAAPWTRIAAHIHAGLRIRFGLHGEPMLPPVASLVELHGGIDAVLTDNGKIEHAEPAALEGRDHLREAARAITRARTHTRRHDAGEALNEWQSLVDGKWTLVDHFDTDGRRFLVARRNPPGGEPHSTLTLDEARAAGFRAMAHPLKLIAYELGFSISTVSKLLGNAARKLGLRSSQEFAQFASDGIVSEGTTRP